MGNAYTDASREDTDNNGGNLMTFPYGPYPPPPYGWHQQEPPKHSGMATAGMVLGIVSLSLTLSSLLVPLVLTTVIGLTLSIIARATVVPGRDLTGFALAGIICNSFAAAIVILIFIGIAAGYVHF